MEIKMKENVNVNSFTFKKKVIEEALELLGRKKNYILNDLKFITMITFTNNLVENNLVIESLYNIDNIEDKMTSIIEPLFEKEVLDKPERLESFNEIVNELIDFMEREAKMRLTIAGFLYDFAEDLGGLTMDDLIKIVNQAIDKTNFSNIKLPNKKVNKKSDEEIKQDALKDIENAKMKALIEKYTREESKKEKDAE